jgi:hypothetical protein
VKKEPTTPMKKKLLLWEKELDLQAQLVRHLDDPDYASGQRLLEARSFNKVQLMDDATACMLSTLDRGNFIELNDDIDDKLEDVSYSSD